MVQGQTPWAISTRSWLRVAQSMKGASPTTKTRPCREHATAWGIGVCSGPLVTRLQFLIAADRFLARQLSLKSNYPLHSAKGRHGVQQQPPPYYPRRNGPRGTYPLF